MANAKATLSIIISATASRAVAAFKSIGNAVSSVVNRMGSMLTSWKTWLASAVLGGGAVAATKAFIEMGASMEQTKLQLKTLMGGAEQGNKLFNELAEFANVTPFSTGDVVDAGKTLATFGIEGENIVKTLKAVGSASAVSGKPIKELAVIYGKVMAKGKAEMESLNQMTEAGIPIVAELSRMYNVTQEGIYKMSSEGKISAQDISTAFDRMQEKGGAFHGALEAMSESTSGKWSTLTGKIETMISTVSDQLQPVIQFVLTKIINYVDSLKDKVADGTIATAILGVVSKVLGWIAQIVEAISVIGGIFRTIYDIGKGIANGICGTFMGIISMISTAIQKAIDGVLAGWNYVADAIGKSDLKVELFEEGMWGNINKEMLKESGNLLDTSVKSLGDAFTGHSYDTGAESMKEYATAIRGSIEDVKQFTESFGAGLKKSVADANKAAENAQYKKVEYGKNEYVKEDKTKSKDDKKKKEEQEHITKTTTNQLLAIGGYGMSANVITAGEKKTHSIMAKIEASVKQLTFNKKTSEVLA